MCFNSSLKYFSLFIFVLILFLGVNSLTFTDTNYHDFFRDGTTVNTNNDAESSTAINLSLQTLTDYYSSGTFVSKVFDSGYNNSSWNSIIFDEKNRTGEELPADAGNEFDISMENNSIYYRFNNNLTDYSNNKNDGTAGNGFSYGSKFFGSASGSFDGSNDLVCVAKPNNLNTSSFTIMGWVKTSSKTNQTIFYRTESSLTCPSNKLSAKEDEKLFFGPTYIQFYLNFYDGQVYPAYYFEGSETKADKSISLGSWNHIAITFSSETNYINYYVNGSPAGSTKTTEPSTITGSYLIGANDTSSPTAPFNGLIDEFTYFNRTLTDEEILNHYKRGVMDLNLQVRSCNTSNCSGFSFVGPDGTTSTYFTDSNMTLWDLNAINSNRYFQYKAFFRTSDTNTQKTTTPSLQEVRINYTPSYPESTPDVNITWPATGTYIHGNHSIDFNVSQEDGLDVIISMWLSRNPGDLNYPLVTDLNLTGKKYCFDADTNIITPNNCSFINTLFNGIDLNIDSSLYPDGNYVIDINANTPYDYNYFTSSPSFMIDNTVPSTANIIIDSGKATTSNPNASLELSCSDAASGCSEMSFSCSNETSWVNDYNLGYIPINDEFITHVFIADADNDGLNEILLTNDSKNNVLIYNWNGNRFVNDVNLLTGSGNRGLFIGDADNDGDNDILVINGIIVLVFSWNGSTWVNDYNLSTGGIYGKKLFINDVDNDGDNDVIIINENKNMLINQWNGLTWVNDYNLTNQYSVFVNDVDNDGLNEIITLDYALNKVKIYSWNGNSFVNDYNLGTQSNPVELFVGDIDNDEDNDIVVINYNANAVVSFYLWNGSTWVNDYNLNSGKRLSNIFVGDVNNNGLNKVIVTDSSGSNNNKVLFYTWTGASFINDYNLVTECNQGLNDLFIADADNDGDNDIVVTSKGYNQPLAFGYNQHYSFTNWENYSSNKSFNLTNEPNADCNSDYGVKTVYVKFKDKAGNTIVSSDSIELVEATPDVNITWPTSSFVKGDNHSIDFNVRIEDNYDLNASIYYYSKSGLTCNNSTKYTLYKDVNLDNSKYCIDLDNNNATTNQCSFVDTAWEGIDLNVDFNSLTQNNICNNYIEVVINASNDSSTTKQSNEFKIDSHEPTSPTMPSTITINSGDELTASTDLNLNLHCVDTTIPSSGCSEMSFSCDNNAGWDSEEIITLAQNEPTDIKITDMDGDGDNDLVVFARRQLNSQTNVYVYLWNSITNSLESPISLTGVTGNQMTIGDIDNDGDMDIAKVGNSSPGKMCYFLFNGISWDSEECVETTGDNATNIAIGDVDNDGDNDVVVTNYSSNNFTFFDWNGNGWDKFTQSSGSIPYGIVIADADNDGKNEVIHGIGYSSGSIKVFSWNGSSFDTEYTLSSLQGYPKYVTVGDADNDGDNDIISTHLYSNPKSMIVHRWNGSGFDSPIINYFDNHVYGKEIFVGDADNDGLNEIVLADYNLNENRILVLDWNGVGWSINSTLSTSNGSTGIFIGDLNNDGFKDIVSTISNPASEKKVSIHYWNSNYSLPETYSSNKIFDLSNYSNFGCSSDYGVKTVYVKYTDAVGNEFITNDSIELVETSPDINITSPILGTYWSKHQSIDFNYTSGEYDLNANIYLKQGTTKYTLYKNIDLNNTSYCIDSDNNKETTNTCSFKNTLFNGIDLNIDTSLYSDNNYTIQIDLNTNGLSASETSSSFMIDNTNPTGTIELSNGKNYTTTNPFDLSLNCSDPGDTGVSGCDKMQFTCLNSPSFEKAFDLNIGKINETYDSDEPIYSTVFVENIDLDEEKEIIAVYNYGNYTDLTPVLIYNWTGSNWVNDYNINVNTKLKRGLFVGDVNYNNSVNEIIVGEDYNVNIYSWNGTGFDFENIPRSDMINEVFIGDSDNDGRNEIIVYQGNGLNELNWIENSWNNTVIEGESTENESVQRNLFIGDATNDGKNKILWTDDVFETNYNPKIYDFNKTNSNYEVESTISKGYSHPYIVQNDLFIADVDNDSQNEVLILEKHPNKNIRIFKWHDSKWNNDYNISIDLTNGKLFVGDADNDRDNDIVVADADENKLIIFDWNESKWSNDRNVSLVNNPLSIFISDLNNDGLNDLVVLEHDGLEFSLEIFEWNDSFTDWENYSSSKSFNLNDYNEFNCNSSYGEKTIFVKYKDKAGNTFTPSSLSFYYTFNPTINLTYPESQYISTLLNSSIDINFTISDEEIDGEGLSYTLNKYYSKIKNAEENLIGEENVSQDVEDKNYSISWDISSLSDGNYFVDLNLNKSVGSDVLISVDSSNPSFYLDGTRPVSSSDVNSNWQNIDANVGLSIVEDSNNFIQTYRIDLDPTDSISWSSWTIYNGAGIEFESDGNYAIDFNAIDAAGNQETSVNRVFVLVDKTIPTSSSDVNSNWQNIDANVGLTCSDVNNSASYSGCSLTKFRVDTDASSGVSYGPIMDYNGEGIVFNQDGNWAIKYWSIDNAGNIETDPTQYVLIQKGNPSVTIDSPTTGTEFSSGTSSVTISYTGTSAGNPIDHYEVRINNGSWINNGLNTSYEFTGLSNGNSYNVDVNVVDSTGKTGTDSVSFSVASSSGSNPQTCSELNGVECIPWQVICDGPNTCCEMNCYGKISEASDTSNCYTSSECKPIISSLEKDLSLSFNITNPNKVESLYFIDGDNIVFNGTIINSGNEDITTSFTVKLYDEFNELIGVKTIDSIDAGEENNVKFEKIFDSTDSIMQNWNHKEIEFKLIIDEENNVDEINELNNEKKAIAKFGLLPNLRFSKKPQLVKSKRENIEYVFKIIDEDLPAKTPFNIGVSINDLGENMVEYELKPLNQGEEIELRYSYNLLTGFGSIKLNNIELKEKKQSKLFLAGNKTNNSVFFFSIDPENNVVESNENDNNTLNTFEEELPDLTFESDNNPVITTVKGNSLTISGKVKNIGETSSSDFKTRVYLKSDFNSAEEKIIELNSIGLTNGSETLVNFELPVFETIGEYYARISIDEDDEVEEESELNNEFNFTIQVIDENKLYSYNQFINNEPILVTVWETPTSALNYSFEIDSEQQSIEEELIDERWGENKAHIFRLPINPTNNGAFILHANESNTGFTASFNSEVINETNCESYKPKNFDLIYNTGLRWFTGQHYPSNQEPIFLSKMHYKRINNLSMNFLKIHNKHNEGICEIQGDEQ